MLEAEGWIHRHYEPTVPPKVTYTLAKRVLELDPVMIELDRIAGAVVRGAEKEKVNTAEGVSAGESVMGHSAKISAYLSR